MHVQFENDPTVPVTAPPSLDSGPVQTARHVYDLRHGADSSDPFYTALAAFADQTLSAIEYRAEPLLDAFAAHAQNQLGESHRSRGEYAMELLALGVFLSRYEGASQKTSRRIIRIARGLVWMREKSPTAKPAVDWIRAGIARYYFVPHLGHKPAKRGSAVDRLSCIIDWLKSTGEFKEEIVRLENWRNCFETLNSEKTALWLRIATELAHDFARNAEIALGSYTQRVAAFAACQQARLSWREDLLMRCKPAVEYHLNLLAAEVMNRGLRDSFLATRQRIVLVPGCMRSRSADLCKARINGVDITCAGCDPACAVNRITREMEARGVRVYIVPHSGGFSRWLARWQQTGAGVTAVACLLNIFPGGLEMRDRGIPSQCLALDFPGCRKHWDALGFPTAVNEPRLVQLATASAVSRSQG